MLNDRQKSFSHGFSRCPVAKVEKQDRFEVSLQDNTALWELIQNQSPIQHRGNPSINPHSLPIHMGVSQNQLTSTKHFNLFGLICLFDNSMGFK